MVRSPWRRRTHKRYISSVSASGCPTQPYFPSVFWTPFFQQSTQRWYEYRRLPRATIVTAGFIVNQPTPSVSNSCSVSTSPSLLRFCSTSELFPRRPRSSHMSDNLLLANSCSVSTSPSLPPKLASVCFLGLPRFLFTAVLFPRLCSAVTLGKSTFDIVCDQGRAFISTLFERMLVLGEAA